MRTRESWPAIPHTYNSPPTSDEHAPGAYEKAKAAVSTAVTSGNTPEDPLYPTAPEYDAAHMPAIPTVVANPAAHPAVSAAPYINPTLDPKRVALIIETRPATVLPALLIHMISVLPPQWVVKMVGTNESFAPVKQSRALGYHIQSTKLQLVDLPDYYPMTDQETVSQTLTNITFYRDFMAPAEWILMFQTDSIMCAASEQSVDDWVAKNYSWVGAPWFPDVYGGNGGLSLRNVSAIVNLLEQEQRPEKYRQWEDMWLSEKLDKSAAIGADEVSFSVESMYYERPLGYHLRGSGKLLDAKVWGNKTRKRQILEYCPEVKVVLGNMQMPKQNQTAERLEEERLDENVWRKAQGLPERLTPSQSSKLAVESASKSAAAAKTKATAAVTKIAATPEQSQAANALAEAAQLASAASLSPEHNSLYVAKEAEASKLQAAAAAAQSTQPLPVDVAGSMTAMPLATSVSPSDVYMAGGAKAVDAVEPTSSPTSSAVPIESQIPTQQGIKELEQAKVKGGYQPQGN